MTTKTTYHAIGSVRGACGHAHRSIAAAVRCAHRDELACRRAGGGAYSDRVVKRTDMVALTEDERDAVVDAYADLD